MEKFRVKPRLKYLSLSDMAQDLQTDFIISKVIVSKSIKECKTFLSELENRIDSDLTENEYFDVLDKCNPVD